MLRGEFIRADGLVIPNNVTIFGKRTMLAAALCNIDTTFFVGLVNAEPDPELLISSLTEPTIGVNGYARIEVLRSSVGWPTEGTLNNLPWFETGWLTWTAVDAAFDQPVRRLMLTKQATDDGTGSDDTLKPLALSAAMPEALVVTPTMDESLRRFKYRLYGA